jgi:hypothetical protein
VEGNTGQVSADPEMKTCRQRQKTEMQEAGNRIAGRSRVTGRMNEDEEGGAAWKTNWRRETADRADRAGSSTTSALVANIICDVLELRGDAREKCGRTYANQVEHKRRRGRSPARQSPQMRRCPDCDSDAKELLMPSSVGLQSENGDTRRQRTRAEWFLSHRLRAIG